MANPVEEALMTLRERIRALETAQRVELSGGVEVLAFVALPTAGEPGRVRFVSNGRKVGEGVGVGTGVLAYDDGVDWRRPSDDTIVAA